MTSAKAALCTLGVLACILIAIAIMAFAVFLINRYCPGAQQYAGPVTLVGGLLFLVYSGFRSCK